MTLSTHRGGMRRRRELKLTIEVRRAHYTVKMELDENDLRNLEESISDRLETIENAVRASSMLWHFDVPDYLKDFVDMLPNGSARFHPSVGSKIDQLVLILGVGGTKGVSTQEASELLSIPPGSITAFYSQEKYKDLFKKLEESRYCLSSSGMKRLQAVLTQGKAQPSEVETEE